MKIITLPIGLQNRR